MISPLADAWFVVQVAPRSERRVSSILKYKGYEQFFPTYRSPRRWSDRVKMLDLPLFPGYVFVRAMARAVGGLICSTPGVMRILSAGARPTPVPDVEIDAIQRLTLLGDPRPTDYLKVGQEVVIRDGPLSGVVGAVREIRNRSCFVVSVDLISQSIYIVVDEFQLAPAASETRTRTAGSSPIAADLCDPEMCTMLRS